MKIYLPSRSTAIPEKLKWHLFYGGDARNARFRKKEIRAAAKMRLLEVKNNKYILICALIDRTDNMNDFKSYMCKTVFHALKYKTNDLINKTSLELAEMLVIAEEIAGRHCHYPNSHIPHCNASKAIAIRKNSLSFSCEYPNCGCDDCEGYGCYECIEKYRTWLAWDLSKEECKDGSLRYGFLKEMLHLYMEPEEENAYIYPEGTFEIEEYNYQNSLARYYNDYFDEFNKDDDNDFDLDI